MALIVNHNIPALQSYNAVNATTNSLQKSIQKLSTGLRINSAADDAAGLAISEKMRAQIRGLDRAVSNSQDGISMIQTAEGALSETHSILQRMRELSVQAANDTLTQQDRAYIQLEVDQLREEVTRIGNTTQFNKKKLLDGSAAVLWTTSDINSKAIVNGGLREIDQFGQKKSAEGNYKITVTASGGSVQVQKSDIMRLKHKVDPTMGIAGTAAGGNGVAAGEVGSLASLDARLYDIEAFWDKQGRFLLTDPQTITITQGDGKQTSITLYQNDTIQDVANKLNKAITDTVEDGGLGQEGVGQLVNYADSVNGNFQTVLGTFVIRSSVGGSAGTLSFSGDEDLMKALSLTTIQEEKELNYTVHVEDAHDATKFSADATITGNRLIGVVHPNIDVEFDPMIGVTPSTGNNTTGSDSFDATTGAKGSPMSFFLHLADNTTVFQIGANEGEDMGINIGDMRAQALNLNRVLVTDRESASRSITIIDNAIDKVSMQRAKLGAYQNRLEHTINNLTVAGENLTAAESRIRDTDMAKEMMNFTKLQIMLQAGTGMLAQANQLPQNVLSLLR